MTFDCVIGGSVDMPALQIDCFIVEAEGRVLGPDPIFVLDGEGWTIAPVEEVAGDLVGIVPLFDQMLKGQALFQRDWDRRLLSSCLAEMVICKPLAS